MISRVISQMRVLIVEDERRLSEALVQIMAEQRYQAEAVYDGADGLDYALSGLYDVIVLDVMLPKLDGFEVARRLRLAHVSTPILMLTARVEDMDKIMGLTLGADDYITKPFNPLELVARVKSQLRRYMHLGNVADENMSVYRVGGLEINDDLKEVKVDGETIRLTPIEYNILLLLLKNVLFIINTSYFLLTYYYFSFWSFYVLIFFSYIN